MPLISICGVELPVLIDSLVITEEVVGTSERNVHGFLLRDARATKWKLSFTIAPKSLEEAMLYEALITGGGDYWPLYPNAMSSKGQFLSGTGTWNDADNTNPTGLNGDWVLAPSNRTCVIQTPPPNFPSSIGGPFASAAGQNGRTIIYAENDGGSGGGTYRLVGLSYRYADTSPMVARQRLGTSDRPWTPTSFGSPQAYNGRCTFSISTTALTIIGPATSPSVRLSHILWLPRAFQQAQVDALLVGMTEKGGIGLPPRPRIGVVTDLLPYSSLVGAANPFASQHRFLVCLGEVKSAPVVPALRGGSFDKTGLQMEVELVEV
jgi:hypothetical protein